MNADEIRKIFNLQRPGWEPTDEGLNQLALAVAVGEVAAQLAELNANINSGLDGIGNSLNFIANK